MNKGLEAARVKSTDDYLRGMADCKAGWKHKKGQPLDYDRGYSVQFEHEQNLTELALRGYIK
jgi:hypothetical protein